MTTRKATVEICNAYDTPEQCGDCIACDLSEKFNDVHQRLRELRKRVEALTAPLLDGEAVAKRLTVKRSQAYILMRQMTHVNVGDRGIRVTEEALADFIRRNTEHPCQSPIHASTGSATRAEKK